MKFKEVDSKMDLPKLEQEMLRFWESEKIFEKSLEIREDSPKYSFYDGPPFATGTPHYGHIVASTMKDVVPRYWTMNGFYVERKWGWDCHGLPIENIAEKELGITSKKQIEEIGIDKFEQACRSKVLGYVSEWEKVIKRLGRWADMENAYRTMDISYMESVWWVFKELWDRGLIYEGYRSMYICPRCETTLSQSEIAEGYRVVKDLSAIAKFELAEEPGTFVLAWTTTPWTLIGNVALAINQTNTYVKFTLPELENEEKYVVAKERLKDAIGDQEYKIIEEFHGSNLVGKSYKPLFDYYYKKETKNFENGWKIYHADFVTMEDGTGVVHIAPAFGEDDMSLGLEYNLPFIQHVNMRGEIADEAGQFAGMQVKPKDDLQKTDVEIIKYLANKGLLFAKEKYEHSYPHCWRCDTPLLNYATSSWFVAIAKIKEDALGLAKQINWSPAYIKEGRFGKWLEGARDWSISRQRYWASVMPIWKCLDCGEIKVFGSIKELEEASGQKITDLHKSAMDKIELDCKCGKKAKRISDVLDTWFDSGSMPYAQEHYPFENKEKFEQKFPADFIAEGVDQTRCWFYYLHVIAAALKKNIAYKNVIVNGIVLAEDGKKMSKKLQNYPDPMEMFDKYGADVLRIYLLTSPVMSAENLNFNEKEMAETQRGLFRMLWNSYYFFTLYANIDKPAISSQPPAASQNLLDKWIISELNKLIYDVNNGMKKYELTKTARLFQPFVDNLSNWYIRRSRKRFWKSENDNDKNEAYRTLYTVLVEFSKLFAPFAPYLSEDIYKNLTSELSVHLSDYPKSRKELIDEKLNKDMLNARRIVEMGLSCRAVNKIKVRQPLLSLTYEFGGDEFTKLPEELEQIIAEEVNVKEIIAKENPKVKLNVEIDTNITEELKIEGLARELIRNIQSLRKEANFNVDDRITVTYETTSGLLAKVFEIMGDEISKEVLAEKLENKKSEANAFAEYTIEGELIWIGVNK